VHDSRYNFCRPDGGDLLVAVPTRDYVFFTGSKEDVAALRDLAEEDERDSHPLTSTILRRTPDGWEAVP
jgi:hypothetical protein